MLSPSQTLRLKFAKLDADMYAAEPEKLRRDFEEIHQFHNHKDFGRICHRVMWRMINSVRKATEENKFGRRDKIIGVLNDILPKMKIDNENKRAALGYINKYDLPLPPRMQDFLQRVGEEEKIIPSTRTRLRQIKDYYRNSDDFTLQTFSNNTKEFLELLADKDTDENLVHFSALYTMLQRRTKIQGAPVQINLFDETPRQPNTVDKDLVAMTASLYGKLLYKAQKTENVSSHFLQKFSNMLVAVVVKNSFSRDEVKRLAKQIKSQSWVSYSVEENLSKLANKLVDAYDFKQEKEIRDLNAWYAKEPKQKPLEQTAKRAVYISMLYRKFIEDADIGRENFDTLYKEEKTKIKSAVVQRYDSLKKREEEVSNESVQTAVLSEFKERDQDKFHDINAMLNRRCTKCSFFFKILNNAQHGGLKYTYPTSLLQNSDDRDLH